MYRRSVAVAAVLALLVVAVAPAIALEVGRPGTDTRVTIVHAAPGEGGADAAYPRLAAEEAAQILRDAGGLAAVSVREATNAVQLSKELRRATSEVLLLTAHGDAHGIYVGGSLVPWETVRADLAASGARFVGVGACDSSFLGEVPGKRVISPFEGDVDRRYVAATLAHDTVQQAIPEIDAEFVPDFLSYVDARGGFERYAELVLAPEETLNPDPACDDDLRSWYAGGSPPSREGCIHFIHAGSPNCHREPDRASELCQKLTATDQDQINSESSGEANITFADGSSGSGGASAESAGPKWYYKLGTLLQSDVIQGSAGGTSASVRYGSVRPDTCISILTYDFTGGGVVSIFKTIWKKFKESREWKDVKAEILPSTENSIGLRLCGYVKSSDVNIRLNAPSEFQAAAALDLRVSYRATVQWEIHLWRWSYWINFGAEGGVKYPFYPAVEGNFQLCPSGSAVWSRYSLDAEISGGGLQIFAYALTGYKEFGMQHDFGWTFAHDTHRARECDGTTTTEAQQNAASRELNPFLTALIGAGLAERNAEPTLLTVQDDGAFVFLNSGLHSVRPGTAAFEHLASTGALDALGIPLDLPLDQQVLLDLTQPRLQEILGMDLGTPTPIVSLREGVAIIPASIPLAAGLRGLCAEPPTGYAALVTANCAGVAPGPLTLTTDEPGVCDPTVDPDNVGVEPNGEVPPQFEAGRIVPGTCHAYTRGAIEAFGDGAAEATGTACGLGPEANTTCAALDGSSEGSGGATGVRLLSAIHSTFQILQRPESAWWLLGSCNVKLFNADAGEIVPGLQQDIGSEAAAHSVCIERIGLDNIRVDLGQVDQELRDGLALLELYAADAPATTVTAADFPAVTDLVPGGGDINQWLNDQLGDTWTDVCPSLSPAWEC